MRSSNSAWGASAFAEGLRWGGGNAKEARRGFLTSPIMMGRRAAKIATRKGAQDKKKAKVYGRIGKQIISAVKAGGTDANANVQLAAVLQAARQSNVPKDIIDRNIKKASDKDQAEYIQQTYEVYGAGGVGIVVEAFTDNLNRAAANIRDAVKKAGGKMADPGSVLFNFERKGIISVFADELEADDLMMAAMDAGADDVKLPEENEDSEEEEGSRRFKVISEMDQFSAVKSSLAENSIHIDEEDSGLAMVPLAHIEVDDAAGEVNEAIMERLLDLDDVDSVFSNMAT
ncbi:YebC-related [Klebsormidium nitens]|uniref:YebC-related n=1 Tax=Klebsormidium nitens TaxID=105231 RepID=A0A1Y1INV7_KLENI|nr:YebC-related [Klebsormidium nitens]|eukprot:GAQ91772.1 YebC-related [Klebsormidium nitens]